MAMNRMVPHSRVGADGVLHISVPIGKEDADRDDTVRYEPILWPDHEVTVTFDSNSDGKHTEDSGTYPHDNGPV